MSLTLQPLLLQLGFIAVGLLNPSASPENGVYPTAVDSALRKLHRLRETWRWLRDPKTSQLEVPSPVLLVLSSKSMAMSHHARQAPAIVLELKEEKSAE